jgi:hypothetical protein
MTAAQRHDLELQRAEYAAIADWSKFRDYWLEQVAEIDRMLKEEQTQ